MRINERDVKAIDWLILLFVILLLSLGTYQRNTLWSDELRLWQDCVKKSPQKERTHHNLGYAHYELGRWADAKKEFEEALRLNPRHALSMYNLGLVFYRQGSMDEAITCYQRAIELDPNYPDSFYNLGIAYYQKGLYREAIEAYQQLLRDHPDYENGYSSLGLAHKGLKQWREAIESFQEELVRHPQNAYTHVYLGETYLEEKDHSKAKFHLEQALKTLPLSDAERIRKLILRLPQTLSFRAGSEVPLSINPEQTPGFRPGEAEGLISSLEAPRPSKEGKGSP